MASSLPPPQKSWSSLPTDLLWSIANRLDTRLDVLRFRAVCYSWRSSTPPPPKPPQPFKLPFPIFSNLRLNPNSRDHILLTESSVYALEPTTEIPENETKTWVIKIHESSESGKVIFEEPLSGFPFENLATHLPKVLNLLEYRVVEVSKAYRLEFVKEYETPVHEFNERKSILIKQVVVSSSLSKVDDGFAVMALHIKGKLSVWRMGDKKWTDIHDNRKKSCYDSITFHNGKFFAVDCNGFTLTVDPISLEISSVGPDNPWFFYSHPRTKFLVKSLGNLFLVEEHRIHFKGVSDDDDDDDDYYYYYLSYFIRFRIYKLIEEICDWVEVDELKDHAFFSANDYSFSVSADDFAGFKRDSVCFADDLFSNNNVHPRYESDAGIFYLRDGFSKPLSEYPGYYSKLFWPPPTWLKKKPFATN